MLKKLSAEARLFLLAFLTLFLELVLIRYLAGNIWNLGYFPNLVLLGVFIGMGTGFVFHHYYSEQRSAQLYVRAAYVLLVLGIFATFAHPPIPGFGGDSGNLGGDLYFTVSKTSHPILSNLMFLIWFGSVISIFFLISQQTAKVFRLFPPLKAYTLDIAGSCLGIICFMGISWFHVPAFAWLIFLAPVFYLAMPKGVPVKHQRAAMAAILAVAGLAFYQDTKLLANYAHTKPTGMKLEVNWSPYQKVEYFNSNEQAHRVHVNGLGHQQMEEASHIRSTWYQVPYAYRNGRKEGLKTRNVLVIGAGGGNDVAAALLNGAEHIDAVEIDPVIADLGRRHHPAKPYLDRRVTVTIDDGRAFMVRAQRKYDLIIFALTDSLVKVSPMAQLRLENYLFTEQSVKRAFQLLSPGGSLVLYNFYRREWLVDKIERMIFNATERAPRRLIQQTGDHFAMMEVNSADPVAPLPDRLKDSFAPVDDWPFLYLEKKGIPAVYLGAILSVGLFIAFLLVFFQRSSVKLEKQTSSATTPLAIKIAFVFMGIAFMLLESKSVIQFALLFGTTWVNNSLVFLGVLLSVLLANWIAVGLRSSWIWGIYALLIASSLLTLVYPLGNLLAIENPVERFFLASAMTFSPIFFANLVFSIMFREQKVAEHIFGWNLIGSTIGGVLEYISMATGYSALAWVVAACYVVVAGCSILSMKRVSGRRSTRTLKMATES